MNTSPFFITGLPRTRSAWLANLFTTGSSLCFHEPKETVTELMSRHPLLRVGVADSTLVFNVRGLMDVYPQAPWLFVERDAQDARRSLMRFTRDTVRLLGRDIDAVFSAHAAAAAPLKRWHRTLVIPFHSLDARMPEIWNHLLPGIDYQKHRHWLLQGLKVEQRFAEAYRERMGG